MPKGPRKEREIEQLRRRRQKAQDNGDIAEEAKICNAIGELYSQSGEWRRALQHHRVELSLSEGGGDQLGAAIAHRRIGECECELGNYSSAIQHQTQHLKVSQKLGNLVEEQRALATLGRTYFVQSQSEEEEGERETLVRAGNAFLRSLDVCDKLVDKVPERELLEMRSRLYLNLGLVYEDRRDIVSARKFMEKALNTVKELGDSATVFRCHFDLGSLHLQERHPALALRCFQEALATAKHQGSAQNEAEALREIGQAHLLMSNFQAAKSCLKQVLLFAENSQGETEHVARQLRVVRKILHYSREVEGVGVGSVGERLQLYDKLGDLCCGVKAYPAAIRFYGQQLTLAEAHGLELKDLSPIYVSLARTHSDCRQFSQALLYFEKELELWRGNPSEECDTWVSIARVRESTGEDSEAVMEAYGRAVGLAERGGNPKQKVAVHKTVVKFCQGRPRLVASCAHWEGELARLLRDHPEVDTSASESESEPLNEDSDPPPSLPSSDLDEEEEEEEEESEATPLPQTARGLAVRKKSRIQRRNEKGETMLHVAAIEGNLAAARQLIREGTEVNVRDNCGWIPLHEACNHGHLDVVRCLIEAGGAVNDGGGAHCGGVTPLIDAAANGHLEVVQLLVQRGADVGARDVEGRTALSILEEQLSSVAESGQRYELLEEHRAIARFLRAEMKRRGVAEGPGGHGRRELGGGTRIRMHDRTGQGVLYDSPDETSADTTVPVLQGSSTDNGSNPFQSFTVVPTPHGDQELSRSSTTEKKKKPPRAFFNPLGQVELPALIPEDEEEERGDFPVVDDWLVDDMGQPPSKRTKHSKFCEPGSSAVKGTQQTSGCSSRRESQRRLASGGRRRRGGGVGRQGSSTSVGSGRGRAIEIGSDSESNPASEGDDDWSAMFDDPPLIDSVLFGNTVAASSSRAHTQTASTQLPQTTAMTEAPLRVRVRIEDKCYVIPCPRKLEDSDTTIGWLATQASERYYSHHSVRPQLSLTTGDGALLCTTDPIAHVLQHNEEVVGVAEHWHLPPLGERYQAACRNAGVACHRRALRLFQSHSSAPSLDLSHLALRESHVPPLLRSLQGQHTLTSLSLAGNRLGDSPMPLLTSCLSFLHLLDLTCTGISTQGLESLMPSSSSSLSSWSGLCRLVLSHNDLGPTAGQVLARLLSLCSGLRELLLDCCGLTSAVLDQHTGLGEALHALTGLTELSLSHNLLDSDGVSHLLSSLPTARLTRLELAATCTHHPLTPALGLPSVAEFFGEAGAVLEWLDLSHCGLAGGGGELGESLQHCRRLGQLKLAGNDLGRDEGGVEELCRFVASSSTLCLLDVGGNSFLGNSGCLRILEASGRSRLSQLNLSACGLRSPLPEEVLELVSLLRPRLRVLLLNNEIDRTDQLLMASESL